MTTKHYSCRQLSVPCWESLALTKLHIPTSLEYCKHCKAVPWSLSLFLLLIPCRSVSYQLSLVLSLPYFLEFSFCLFLIYSVRYSKIIYGYLLLFLGLKVAKFVDKVCFIIFFYPEHFASWSHNVRLFCVLFRTKALHDTQFGTHDLWILL